MKFTKMQGAGNDYIYVDCTKKLLKNPSKTAIKVSERHFGIGSDGLILIKPSEVADFQMDMYNADGSRGAMCGNGIRCVAKYVYDYGLTDKTSVSVETASGIKYLDLTVENGKVVLVKVNMGAPILEAAKIPVVSEKEQVNPFFFALMPAALKRLAPDVLVPCTALPNIWGRLWGRLLGIPIVGTVRGGGAPRRQHERFLWRLTDHMVCNSEALADVLSGLGIPAARLTYVPNGVDTERFAPAQPAPSERPPLIVCVARLAEDKDHLTLLKGFALLRERHPDVRLRLVGDGPREKELKAWVAEHLPDGGVEFCPGSPDVRAHYAAARIFALTSVREGQPNVILEAMAAGLPVCATETGGIPRLVTPGESGLLSPVGDSAAFADNCAALLEDPARGDMFGLAGRQRVERSFSFEAMVAAHEAIFLRLAARERA